MYFISFVVIFFFAMACSAFEVHVAKLVEPPLIRFRKLYADPDTCYQMTWDSEWDKINPYFCRGLSCHGPYFNGPVSPDPTIGSSRICNLGKGESCIKYVIYDKLDKKTPIFISRYCGVVTVSNTGERVSNSCHRNSVSGNDVEVCVCRDLDKCNSGNSTNGNIFSIIFVTLIYLIFTLLIC
jgi:hypothetical protein